MLMLRWCDMKRLAVDRIDIILLIVLLLALWAILSIQLKVIPVITVGWQQDTIASWNTVFLNLSYSYIAALIFYGLTTRLPVYRRKMKLKPVIQKRISEIGREIYNILLEFARETGYNHEYRNITDTDAIMRSKDWMAIMPSVLRFQNIKVTYLNFLKAEAKAIKDKISDVIQKYKDEMTEEQLVALEALAHAQFFHQVEFLSSIVLGRIDEGGYDSLISDFIDMQKQYLEVERLFEIEER